MTPYLVSQTAALRLVKGLYALQADGGGMLGNLPGWLGNAIARILAAGVALAVGIAFGWGGHSYVAENLGRWSGSAKNTASGMTSKERGSPADDD